MEPLVYPLIPWGLSIAPTGGFVATVVYRSLQNGPEFFADALLIFLIPGILRTFVSFTAVTAAPIPVPSPNDVHASAHSHGTPPPHTLAFGAAHTPRIPSHVAPGSEKFKGFMPVHPSAQHGMTQQQLHEHAHHIATQLNQGQHGAPHVVHAEHTPGHMNVRFTAVRDPNSNWAQHPAGHTETLHVPKNKRPEIHTPTMNAAQQQAMYGGLVNHQAHHTVNHVPAQPGVHGEGKHGTLFVDPAHQNAGLSQDQLKVHAHFVAQNLFPHPQNHDVRVEVKHKPGDTHATYHAVTADGGVISPGRYPPPTAAEATAIRQHVASTFAGGHDHNHASSTPPNQRWMFSGGLPAHDGAPHHMSPEHMTVYSSAIKDALRARHATGTPQQIAHAHQEINSMAMTSIHQPGGSWVAFGTQPRTADAVKSSAANLHPDLTAAHTHPSVGHTLSEDPTKAKVHAESKLLDEFLKDPGIAATEPGSAHHALQGVSIGVSGQGDKPCSACHKVLGQFPVHYTGMRDPLPQGVTRAIDLK